MKAFLDNDFLLDNDTAKELFTIAQSMPIVDFHCHLSPKEIYENQPFGNITAVWLGGDHYKWRAMRSFGIDEKYITGDSTDLEKFKAWAQTLPYCIGNPLYHWTHLELQRYFDIDTPLTPKTADEIWEKANRKLRESGFTPREIIRQSNVKVVCTTDDPIDSLEFHEKLAADPTFPVKVLPAFRPDKALRLASKEFSSYVQKLSAAADLPIKTFKDLTAAIEKRVAFFAEHGCVASDHAFIYVPYAPASAEEVEEAFQKGLQNDDPTQLDVERYQTALLTVLARAYTKHHIVMEMHIGALRDDNGKMFRKLGPDTGFDSVHDHAIAEPLTRMLDSLNEQDILPRTVLFSLDPSDNYILGTLIGSFQSPEAQGKMQLGCAWWFNDHIDGMRRIITDLANLGVLGSFIGMVTDSRSFLSYPRHEYFRRILCNWIGTSVEHGEYPNDKEILTSIVQKISYQNAVDYFGL